MMNKSRSVVGKRNPSPEPINDVCPHQHFKSDIIDRNILSRKQHLNVLCTPKGYRWMIKKADPSTMKGTDGLANNSPCRLTKKKPGNTYVHNILAEMWDFITPEMVNRMKEMLMTEFGLSEEAALDFICQSRYDTTLTANPANRDNKEHKHRGGDDDRPPEGSAISCLTAAQKLCKNDFNIDINPFHIKEFSKTVSSKFSEYVAAMMCAKRNSKHRTMAEVILKGLCDLTGEETTLDSPKNRLHKILATTSDRVALWLVGNMEDDDNERAKRRRREDTNLKRKIRAKQKDEKNRQKEKDKINKEREKNEKRKAQEQAEKSKSANEEQERKKAEREKRHQELEKFREEEKRKQKEEIKKAKEESATAKGAQARSGGGQAAGGDRSKITGPKQTGQNYKPTNEQYKKGESSGSRGQVASGSRAPTSNVLNKGEGKALSSVSLNKGKGKALSSVSLNKGKGKALSSVSLKEGEGKAFSSVSNQPVRGAYSRSEVPASESLAGVSPASETAEKKGPLSRDTESKAGLNKNEAFKEISNTSQLSASKSVNWGDNQIKNVASAFSASGKVTPTPSTSSSVDKFAELLTSRGKAASGRKSQEKSATASSSRDGLLSSRSSQDRLPASLSSQGIHAKVVGSQGKLASELSSHSKLGTASSSHGPHPATDSDRRREDLEQELGSASSPQGTLSATDRQRRKGSLLTVKKIGSRKFEIRKINYSEAKRKIEAVRRESGCPILPPNVPFDPNDPQSWAQWVDYAARMAEDWGNWIDKTIQETEDKAILYQAKAIEGKTQPEDIEDWNRFVEKTNEDAIRWRRQRKSMFDAAKEWKQL